MTSTWVGGERLDTTYSDVRKSAGKGTRGWRAPEQQLVGGKASTASDVYSVGLLLLVMASKCWQVSDTLDDHFQRLCWIDSVIEDGTEVRAKLSGLVSSCLKEISSDRISSSDFLSIYSELILPSLM